MNSAEGGVSVGIMHVDYHSIPKDTMFADWNTMGSHFTSQLIVKFAELCFEGFTKDIFLIVKLKFNLE